MFVVWWLVRGVKGWGDFWTLLTLHEMRLYTKFEIQILMPEPLYSASSKCNNFLFFFYFEEEFNSHKIHWLLIELKENV